MMSRLLITNHSRNRHGGIYLLDPHTKRLRKLYGQPTRGLTRADDGQYYFVHEDGTVFRLEPESWQVTRVAQTGFHLCHDLRFIGDCFYLVASRGNHVVRLDRQGKVIDLMQIVEKDGDVCHANCITQADGELLLTIFTLSPGKRTKKTRSGSWQREGKVLRLDWRRKAFEVLHEPLAQPHNPVWHQGRLYLCESRASQVVVLSADWKTKETVSRLYGFVRGLQFVGDSLYVGVSKIDRNPTRWQQFKDLFRVSCGVMELDAQTGALKRKFRVPGIQVYDVLALDVPQAAGHPARRPARSAEPRALSEAGR